MGLQHSRSVTPSRGESQRVVPPAHRVTSRKLSRVLIAAAAALTVLFASAPAIAQSDDPADYPTWAEVEAAKASEADTQATLARLETALASAQAEAAAASTAAVEAGVAVREAEQDLEMATERASVMSSRLSEAETEFAESSEALSRTISWLYRDGTGLARYSELASAENADQFMAKLSVATQVTGTWNTLTDQATVQVNTVNGLREQAETAREERESRAQAAQEAADAAQAARVAADAAVATAEDRTDTVFAQLAELKGTTAEIEQQYQLGVQVAEAAAERERERQAEEARKAARQAEREASNSSGGSSSSGSSGGSGGSGGTPSTPPNPGTPGIIVDPAAAQAYARNAIGAYGWGGDQFSCLVDLWNGESNWRVDATNPWSGAYGIPQSWPAEKLAAAGPDWRTNAATQINWGLAYIDAAYGSPCNAWYAWLARDPHWY